MGLRFAHFQRARSRKRRDSAPSAIASAKLLYRGCLVRSLLLFWLLKARGEPAELLIGVSKETSGLQSHAWIETQGKILVDRPEVAGSYATLLRF